MQGRLGGYFLVMVVCCLQIWSRVFLREVVEDLAAGVRRSETHVNWSIHPFSKGSLWSKLTFFFEIQKYRSSSIFLLTHSFSKRCSLARSDFCPFQPWPKTLQMSSQRTGRPTALGFTVGHKALKHRSILDHTPVGSMYRHWLVVASNRSVLL